MSLVPTLKLPTNIIGRGPIAEFLRGKQLPQSLNSILVAEISELDAFSETLAEAEESLVFIGIWRTQVYIHSGWKLGESGCPLCLVTRIPHSDHGPNPLNHPPEGSEQIANPQKAPSPASLRRIELRLSSIAEAQNNRPAAIFVLDCQSGVSSMQFLLPDGTCIRCSPDSTSSAPQPTRIDTSLSEIEPLTKIRPDALRTRAVTLDSLNSAYLFPGIGLFATVNQDLQSPFGACSVDLSTPSGRREPAIGRARDYASSRSIAVLEGLERYAGLHRGGAKTMCTGSYQQLADRAMYPPDLGTHPDESYIQPGFRYHKFDPNTIVDWVWAYSYRRDAPILIPERSAFWGPRHDGEVSFAFDTSNGCALGNSVEEATLHGLREVIERDSFLLAWYRELQLPEVDITGHHQELDQLLRKACLFTGFQFRCFQSTLEFGMPSFLLLAENSQPTGPAIFTGSGAHPDPVQAIIGGLYELIGTILAALHNYADDRDLALNMLADFTLVRRMPDHSLVSCLPEARHWFDFLPRDKPQLKLRDIPSTLMAGKFDLRADLHHVIRSILKTGTDVLVVDQTMPELRLNNFHCVRVVVPGALPMTFGQQNRRTANLPRLNRPADFPYSAGISGVDNCNPRPHPFP
jgi:ribosomal protein S12 methylthiotransferase accessory factor